MNRILVILACLAAALPVPAGPRGPQTAPRLTGNISMSGAWAVYPMALKWSEEFRKVHPGVTIDIQAGGAGKGMADTLAGMVDIGMVSREVHPAEIGKGAVPFAVVRDAVVPVINAGNPFLRELRSRGLCRDDCAAIWLGTNGAPAWEGLLGRDGRSDVHIYTRSDACGAAETWAAYLGGRQEDLGGIAIYGDPGLADAVRRDPLGIGFNNVNFAYDAKTKKPIAGLAVMPLDLDGNRRLDPAEDFYGTRDALIAAIADGRYPSPPARDLYFVTRGRPSRAPVAEFLRWILTDGQAYVAESGYISLGAERLAAEAEKLR